MVKEPSPDVDVAADTTSGGRAQNVASNVGVSSSHARAEGSVIYGGARAGHGSGRSVGMRSTAVRCSMSARRRSRPPQRGHASTSNPKVRRINSAHRYAPGRRRDAASGRCASPVACSVAGDGSACGGPVQATAAARQRARGASTANCLRRIPRTRSTRRRPCAAPRRTPVISVTSTSPRRRACWPHGSGAFSEDRSAACSPATPTH
jgi:hypothetical protein